MSDFSAIRWASRSLQGVLQAALPGVTIDLRTPKEMDQNQNAQGVSLWLYRVVRNPDLLNQPLPRPAPNQILRGVLPLDLYYLLTPLRRDVEDEQMLLGRAMQTLSDHPVLRGSDLVGSLAGSDVQLRVTLEEITRVWTALQEPYRLSVSYHVQAVIIESDLEPIQTAPVLRRRETFDQIVSD